MFNNLVKIPLTVMTDAQLIDLYETILIVDADSDESNPDYLKAAEEIKAYVNAVREAHID